MPVRAAAAGASEIWISAAFRSDSPAQDARKRPILAGVHARASRLVSFCLTPCAPCAFLILGLTRAPVESFLETRRFSREGGSQLEVLMYVSLRSIYRRGGVNLLGRGAYKG